MVNGPMVNKSPKDRVRLLVASEITWPMAKL